MHIPEVRRLERGPGEEALAVLGPWEVAWYRGDGACLGRIPLPDPLAAAFAPGEHLAVFLEDGTLLRWLAEPAPGGMLGR